jgi:hypothetical protein
MACDLSDPKIQETYQEIISGGETDWMLLGYHDTRDTISLYSKGTGGLDELRANLLDEVLYGFVRIGTHYLLITYMNDQVSGVRRARALVHGRAVASTLERHDLQISVSSEGELSEASIRSRFRQLSTDSGPAVEATRASRVSTSPIAQKPPTPQPPAPGSDQQAPVTITATEPGLSPGLRAVSRSPSPVPPPPPPVSQSPPPTSPSSRPSSPPVSSQRSSPKIVEPSPEEKARTQQEEQERLRRLHLQQQAQQAGKDGQLHGFITVQGNGCYFWKRRFFVLKGTTMFLYRDELAKAPLTSIELGGRVRHVEDAQAEVLIPNSFRVDFANEPEPFYFFADDREQKEAIMRSIQRCA